MCFLAFKAFALPVFALIYMAMNEKALICHAFLQICLPKQWGNTWQVSEMPYSAMLLTGRNVRQAGQRNAAGPEFGAPQPGLPDPSANQPEKERAGMRGCAIYRLRI